MDNGACYSANLILDLLLRMTLKSAFVSTYHQVWPQLNISGIIMNMRLHKMNEKALSNPDPMRLLQDTWPEILHYNIRYLIYKMPNKSLAINLSTKY